MKVLDSPLRLFILTLFVLFGISGCTNNFVDINETQNQARSEKDFVDNIGLRATPQSVVVLNLEDLNSPRIDSIPDTDTLGADVFYVKYTENVTRAFRMETTARFSVQMINVETGENLFYIDWYNPYAQVYISAGDYKMFFHSWLNYAYDSLSGKQTIFIKPEGQNNSNTFITMGGCPNCDLSYIDLNHMNISYIDFSGANFSKSNISSANLNHSNFENSNFENAYLYNSIATGVDFSNSFMKGVIFRSADLKNSSFSNCDISFGDFRFADIRNGTFCGANKEGIISNGIVYDGSTQCWP